MNRTTDENREAFRLPRADVEGLLLVHACGEDGCTPDTLTSRLGLHARRTPAVLRAAAMVADRGWLEVDTAWIEPTDEGAEALEQAIERCGAG